MNKRSQQESLHQEMIVDAYPPGRQPRFTHQHISALVPILTPLVGFTLLVLFVGGVVFFMVDRSGFLAFMPQVFIWSLRAAGAGIAISLLYGAIRLGLGSLIAHVARPLVRDVIVPLRMSKVEMQAKRDVPFGNEHFALYRGGLNAYQRSGTRIRMDGQQDVAQIAPPEERKGLLSPQPALPDMVPYEDIRHHIPHDHTLVGIGEQGVVTRERIVKGLIWVPGGSESGKSNTVGLRVEEDYNRGYRFLGIDPHAFKDDSLTNLVRPYMDRFLMPIAYKPEDILEVLHAFLAEFEKRKAGSKCWPITLLYDEVGSQVSDKPEDELERQIIVKTKEVARVGGQEVRGFNMGVTMISQDAAGLAWLRKRALMVLGHKMLAMSERELVCNQLTNIAREMDEWPIGRTVVYGIAFKGVHVYQQPLFSRGTVDADPYQMPAMPVHPRFQTSTPEAASEASGSAGSVRKPESGLSTEKILRDIGKRIKKGESPDEIRRSLGIDGGRAHQEFNAAVQWIQEEMEA